MVEVSPPISPPWHDQWLRALAAAPDGSSYALFGRMYCAGQAGCFDSVVLFHYLSDGNLDPSFGGPQGYFELPNEGKSVPVLAVDSAGRPVIARSEEGEMRVWRLTRSGVLDPTFDGDGFLSFECACIYGQGQLAPGPGGTLSVGFSEIRQGAGRYGFGQTGTITTVVRLRADGSRVASFGTDGSSTFGLVGTEPFGTSAVGRGGALYLAGGGCCSSPLPGYVTRLSAKGKFDRRFTAAARRALRPLSKFVTFSGSVNAVLIRRRGKIDLLGAAGYEHGFMLRLRPNGQPDRRFGKNGLRILPFPIASAALGSEGAVMAVSAEGVRAGGIVVRILPNGRLDRRFGRERVPDGEADHGMSIVTQKGRTALVLDRGLQECRGYCGEDPKLVRYLEVPRRNRR
ncbi:MAG TPA: hypothetical protein VFN85_07040 [Solirubrobacterales bacterium]|nr:hypothetical protein [Solirubrobacterales bacterium]